MAHQRTGAAPPPEAVALPATTPRPGGPDGDRGERSSPAVPVGGALGRCAVALDAGSGVRGADRSKSGIAW
jgi:hypothetical protein